MPSLCKQGVRVPLAPPSATRRDHAVSQGVCIRPILRRVGQSRGGQDHQGYRRTDDHHHDHDRLLHDPPDAQQQQRKPQRLQWHPHSLNVRSRASGSKSGPPQSTTGDHSSSRASIRFSFVDASKSANADTALRDQYMTQGAPPRRSAPQLPAAAQTDLSDSPIQNLMTSSGTARVRPSLKLGGRYPRTCSAVSPSTVM
jgi:hypothetical protein